MLGGGVEAATLVAALGAGLPPPECRWGRRPHRGATACRLLELDDRGVDGPGVEGDSRLGADCFTPKLYCGRQSFFYCPPPTYTAYPIAILLHDHRAIYAPPTDPRFLCHTPYKLGVAISCKGQPGTLPTPPSPQVSSVFVLRSLPTPWYSLVGGAGSCAGLLPTPLPPQVVCVCVCVYVCVCVSHITQLTPQQQSAESRNSAGA